MDEYPLHLSSSSISYSILLQRLPRDTPVPPPSPPLIPRNPTTALTPDDVLTSTTPPPPLPPLRLCIDCNCAPPHPPDLPSPAVLILPCLHAICHPCFELIIADLDAATSLDSPPPSLRRAFCHVCHPFVAAPARRRRLG